MYAVPLLTGTKVTDDDDDDDNNNNNNNNLGRITKTHSNTK
jgi:hypothetical protein